MIKGIVNLKESKTIVYNVEITLTFKGEEKLIVEVFNYTFDKKRKAMKYIRDTKREANEKLDSSTKYNHVIIKVKIFKNTENIDKAIKISSK